MISNKRLIITSIIAVVILVGGVGSYLLTKEPKEVERDLPVVYENEFPDTKTEVEEDFADVELPEEDIPGVPVDEEELPTPEEVEEIKEIETVQEVKDVVKPPEEIVADNAVIEKAEEEAAVHPDVQPVPLQPVEIEPAPEEPAKDADGYIYTKEQAVKMFTDRLLSFPDTSSNSPASALAYAKKKAERKGREFDQEAFDADLNLLLTDPYSSPMLTPYLENYRATGDMNLLLVFSSEWLSLGGDDGEWAERETR